MTQSNQSTQKIQKYRISLSIPEMHAIVTSLSKDSENLLENAELVGWIRKQIRKAEFQVLEASHTSGPSALSIKSQNLADQVVQDVRKKLFESYKAGVSELQEAEIIQALQYKAEHPLECGTLEDIEQEILNAEMMKAFSGGL